MTEAPTSMGFENEISLQTNLKKKAIENGEKIQPNTAASCGRERVADRLLGTLKKN
jgi:hypothetical protein